ncbi:energy transducer TonB [Sphingomonas sp. HMP6]|uniref:energy transducer TonB n=1 Tax=Sphingomonas sp. HMP6 TaxID=1517551 RepID=UPI001E365C7E|nr:energy transducer TonB [Sphingomonas sp. HMP6]
MISGLAGQVPGAAPDTPTTSVAAPADSPAMAIARANRTKMKAPPRPKARLKPDYPEVERAALHGGTVSVAAIVNETGTIEEATIVRSSSFPALDAAALDVVRTGSFIPAKDANDTPIAVPVSLPIRFDPYDLSGDVTVATEPEQTYPDAERAAGHHGRVLVVGVVDVDGALTRAEVSASSRAPGLDAAALATARATRFEVRRDDKGQALPTPVRMAYEYDSFRSPGKGGGVLRYRCDQFVLDQDWWRSTFPPKERGEFYTMMLGLGTLAQLRGGKLDFTSASLADFEVRWTKAIEACRAHPTTLMIDHLKPEGEWARRAAEPRR